jgi:hypothetical protein
MWRLRTEQFRQDVDIRNFLGIVNEWAQTSPRVIQIKAFMGDVVVPATCSEGFVKVSLRPR